MRARDRLARKLVQRPGELLRAPAVVDENER